MNPLDGDHREGSDCPVLTRQIQKEKTPEVRENFTCGVRFTEMELKLWGSFTSCKQGKRKTKKLLLLLLSKFKWGEKLLIFQGFSQYFKYNFLINCFFQIKLFIVQFPYKFCLKFPVSLIYRYKKHSDIQLCPIFRRWNPKTVNELTFNAYDAICAKTSSLVFLL